MGLSHEENLLDLTPHDLGKGCGSGRLFAVVFPRSRRASFSEFRRASSLKLVRPSATAREHSRSRIAFGEEAVTSCLTRVGGPEIGWGWIAGRALARQFLPLKKPWFETPHPAGWRASLTTAEPFRCQATSKTICRTKIIRTAHGCLSTSTCPSCLTRLSA